MANIQLWKQEGKCGKTVRHHLDMNRAQRPTQDLATTIAAADVRPIRPSSITGHRPLQTMHDSVRQRTCPSLCQKSSVYPGQQRILFPDQLLIARLGSIQPATGSSQSGCIPHATCRMSSLYLSNSTQHSTLLQHSRCNNGL